MRIPFAALIIPTYGPGGVALVDQCLTSFFATHPGAEPEIFVVSDGDGPEVTDQLAAVCDRHNHAELIIAARGGFAKACNAGLRCSNAAVSYLVNNDIEFIEPTLYTLGDAVNVTRAGVIGCRLLYPDRTIQHAGVAYIPRENGPGYFDHRLRFEIAEHPYAIRMYPSLVTGALLGITRWYLDVVGYLDERFGFAVEDIDACLSAFEAGQHAIYCGYTAAIHHEGKTRGRTLEEKQARFPELIAQEDAALKALHEKWVTLDWSNFQ